MKKWLILGIFLITPIISYAESGNQRVYDYSGSGGGGTTTSYGYVWDGTGWQKVKGDTSGYSYVIVGTGSINITTLPNITVGTGSMNIINEPDIDIQKIKGMTIPISTLPGHPYIGCLSFATITSVAKTNVLIIDNTQSGKTTYILKVEVINRGTTGGNVDLYWDSAGTDLCHPGAVNASVGAGFEFPVYLSKLEGDVYLTSVPPNLGITIHYKIE